MASSADVISSVNASKESWNIVARVVQLWAMSMGDRSRNTTSIEMILVDVEDLVSEFVGALPTDCHDLGVGVDFESVLPMSPTDGSGSSKGKNHLDHVSCFKLEESATKWLASDVVGIMHEEYNPKLLKLIKIEKP